MHDWNITPKEAIKIQNQLAQNVVFQDIPNNISTIAGFDVSYSYQNNKMIAGAVILEYPSLKEIDRYFYIKEITFPYIPGFLSFREAPAIVELINKNFINTDIFFFDGHGIAHPRGLGIASHVGVLLNISTIGCAKKKLVGDYEIPENSRGSYSNLVYKENIIGKVLRTKVHVKPIYISVGNLLILENLSQFVLNCTKKYRLPEPTRLAHLAVTDYKREKYS